MNWSRKKIQEQWRPVDFDYPASLSAVEQQYCRFYGIDLERELDHFEHGFGYLEFDGLQLATHYYRPRLSLSRGTFLLQHGYFDHSGLYRHLIRFCLAQNYSVIIYDLPGHGLSTGARASINDFQEYVAILEHYNRVCRPHFDEPWHLVGQSTGGAIAMAYLLANRFDPVNTPFQKVFLLAPLVRAASWNKLLWLYRLSRRWRKSAKRKLVPCSHDAEFMAFIKDKDPLQYHRVPLLWVTSLIAWADSFEQFDQSRLSPVVIQGGEDVTVDWRYNLAAIDRKFSSPKVHMLPQARHHLVNEAAELRDQIFAILASYLA